MCEDVARTVHIARQLGDAAADRRRPTSTASTSATRTSTASERVTRCVAAKPAGLVPHRQPAPVRPETLDQVADQSAADRSARSTGSRRLSRRDRLASRCSPTPPAIRRVMLEANADPDCVGVIAWMHTFSPAKMWIAGLDALRKPLLHLHTQLNAALPWASIDMDFMNLNQAAHGDREFGYIQTRLGRGPQDRRRARERPGAGRRAIDALDPRRARAATTCAALRLARFGDNMRDVAVTEGDKVEAELRFGVSVNTYGVNDLVARGRRGRRRRRRRAGRRVRRRLPARAGAGARAATGTSRCATPPGSRPGCASSSPTGGFGAFTTNFQDLGGLRQLPGLAVQRLMADGYGFGGEGDWKTSALLRRGQGDGRRTGRRHLLHGGLHLPLRPGRAEDPRRAHARGLPDASPRTPPSLRDPPAGHRRPGGPGAAGLRRRARARPS